MDKEKHKPRRPDILGCFIKAIRVGIIVMFLAGCAFSIWFMTLVDQRSRERKANCERLMSQPLAYEVTEDLCERGLMPSHISECSPGEPAVKTSDMPDIVRANVEIGVSTFDDVNSMFGQYAVYCDDVNAVRQNPSLTTFSCDYVSYPLIRIQFDKNTQIVTGIRVLPCDSGS
jgi:hypothetical protein